MNYSIVFCLLAVGSLWAAPASKEVSSEIDVFQRILNEHKDLLPSEIVEAYHDLTEPEKTILKEVFVSEKSINERDFIRALKVKSPELGERVEKVYDRLQKKIDALSEKPRKFMTTLVDSGRILHRRTLAGERIQKETVRLFIDAQYDAFKTLSDESREEVRKEFPGVVKFLQNDKIKEEITKLVAEH